MTFGLGRTVVEYKPSEDRNLQEAEQRHELSNEPLQLDATRIKIIKRLHCLPIHYKQSHAKTRQDNMGIGVSPKFVLFLTFVRNQRVWICVIIDTVFLHMMGTDSYDSF